MSYLEQLEYNYAESEKMNEYSNSKLEWLGEFLFDFIAYDPEITELFSKKMIEVCQVITDRKTFEYQENEDNYLWYMIMVNMSFLQNKLNWGTSIRGAWWGIYDSFVVPHGILSFDYNHSDTTIHGLENWNNFINSLSVFTQENKS